MEPPGRCGWPLAREQQAEKTFQGSTSYPPDRYLELRWPLLDDDQKAERMWHGHPRRDRNPQVPRRYIPDLLRAAGTRRQLLLLSQRCCNAIINSGSAGSRISVCRLRGNLHNLFVICAYVPHRGRTEPAQPDTYKELDLYWAKFLRATVWSFSGISIAAYHAMGGQGNLVGRWCMHTEAD